MANPPATANPLFQQINQLNRDSSANLAARHGIQDTVDEWNNCFAQDLQTKLIDVLYPYLWLVARKEGSHIDSLHEQLIKGRMIVIAENPKLHLVWYYQTIYLKPLPDYLLNYTIWITYLTKPNGNGLQERYRYDKYKTAVGFLRSYSLLIRHESDFIIAQKANLLPKYVCFQQFQMFIRHFRLIQDEEVSYRYHYGQFRLTRLNWIVRIAHLVHIFYPTWTDQPIPLNYQEQAWQTGQYLQKYASLLIFTFATLSLILSSMQVALTAYGPDTWKTFVRASWGFSIATIIFTTIPILGAPVVFLIVMITQGQFAIRMKWKAVRSKRDVEKVAT